MLLKVQLIFCKLHFQTNRQHCLSSFKFKNFKCTGMLTFSLFILKEESVRNNDGGGYKNVIWKVCSRCFKLYGVYSISFNSANNSEFCWSWILNECIKVQKKKKKIVVLCSRPPRNLKILRKFHIVVVQPRQRNIQKGVIHVRSCCFANLNLLLFCSSRCRCSSIWLSSLITI